ncbi:MAG: hypothetical protein Q7J35_18615 [Candidatus Methanoperedens sp.]|nr:hypothetical protein [Candidatus Methanoperedens sp.]
MPILFFAIGVSTTSPSVNDSGGDMFGAVITKILPILMGIAFAIFLLYIRRPSIEFIPTGNGFPRDDPTDEDRNHGRMWYHIWVKNKDIWKPFKKIFDRTEAASCMVTVEFFEGDKKLRQIDAHWVHQSTPGYGNNFDDSKIPLGQKMTIGSINPEQFDVLIKRDGEDCFYIADPHIVYRYPEKSNPSEWERNLKIDAKEVRLIISVKPANSNNIEKAEYLLKNKGNRKEDISCRRLISLYE